MVVVGMVDMVVVEEEDLLPHMVEETGEGGLLQHMVVEEVPKLRMEEVTA